MRSNCELLLDEGAKIVFSQEPEDNRPAVHTTMEDVECANRTPLVYAYCCTNMAITGTGTLCGHEGRWQDTRPQLVLFNRCKGVTWQDFKVRNSPFWTLHLYMCEDVAVRNLDACAQGCDNACIDIEMSRDVIVEKCRFDHGDDGIVMKSGRKRDAWRRAEPKKDVFIRDCEIF